MINLVINFILLLAFRSSDTAQVLYLLGSRYKENGYQSQELHYVVTTSRVQSFKQRNKQKTNECVDCWLGQLKRHWPTNQVTVIIIIEVRSPMKVCISVPKYRYLSYYSINFNKLI